MTDEQIKQNADVYAMRVAESHIIEQRPFYVAAFNGFMSGAHSRDEEIKELEKALAAAEDVLDVQREKLDQLRNPWISVDERLPEVGHLVFVHENNGIPLPQVAFIDSVSDIYGKISWIEINGSRMTCDAGNVTHWMPIPQIEKGE